MNVKKILLRRSGTLKTFLMFESTVGEILSVGGRAAG
jgi:hypothetical protein